MKKLIILLMVFIMISSGSAQKKNKQKEFGLGLENLDNFALIFKFGHQKSMWRLMGVYGRLHSYTSEINEEEDKITFSSFRASFGKQFHSYINNDFKIIYGTDLNFIYSSSKDLKQEAEYDYERNRTVYTPGFNIVLGFNYDLNENFVVGLELLPGVSYSFGETEYKNANNGTENYTENTKEFSVGASTSSALLTLAYRFGKNSE